MRLWHPVFLFSVLISALAPLSLLAQGTSVIVRGTVSVPADGTASVELYCPPGYVPVRCDSTSVANVSENASAWVDSHGVPDDFFAGFPGTVTQLPGAGRRYSFASASRFEAQIDLRLACLRPTISVDETIVVNLGTFQIAPRTIGSASAPCDPGQAAVGGIDNADGSTLFKLSDEPMFGSLLLGDIPDGMAAPPSGWQSSAFNLGHTAAATFSMFTYCINQPSLQTWVASVPLNMPGGKFTVWNSIPGNMIVVGSGFDGGSFGLPQGGGFWDAPPDAFEGFFGNYIVNALAALASPPKQLRDLQVGAGMIRALFTLGVDTRPPQQFIDKTSTRATQAILVVPSGTQPDPVIPATVIEFYNAARDHYFISSLQAEIDALDSGQFPGWVRTGQTFNAYGIGSGGAMTRRPVCRYYGLPAAGLDSHFYSASLDECLAVADKFANAWQLEAAEVMEIDLPDPSTGACPGGDIPVYRLWNARPDSNHRYTTSTVIRDQMLTKGYVAEGYGPNSVALCALS
jgi:Repeat of unknown function (DUF5648)